MEEHGINDFQLTKNFNLREFDCRCCKRVKIARELVERLQRVRDRAESPIIVTSGYRCPEWNKKVGGVSTSFHLRGQACDIIPKDISLPKLALFCIEEGFSDIIEYADRKFLHVGVYPSDDLYLYREPKEMTFFPFYRKAEAIEFLRGRLEWK
jgi:uncharacterized protein YcbK (DUF882 family)